MATHLDHGQSVRMLGESAAQPARRNAFPGKPDLHRILAVVRWPVGGIRTHILYNYPTATEHGYRFTFVGPDDATLETFAASLGAVPESEFVGVPVQGPRCRLWSTVRRLLASGRFAFLHSHGLTAAVH